MLKQLNVDWLVVDDEDSRLWFLAQKSGAVLFFKSILNILAIRRKFYALDDRCPNRKHLFDLE